MFEQLFETRAAPEPNVRNPILRFGIEDRDCVPVDRPVGEIENDCGDRRHPALWMAELLNDNLNELPH